MERWVVYKSDSALLVGQLLSTKGHTYAYVGRVFEKRVPRTCILGAFTSEDAALRAMRTIRDDPMSYLLRSEVSALEGYVTL